MKKQKGREFLVGFLVGACVVGTLALIMLLVFFALL